MKVLILGASSEAGRELRAQLEARKAGHLALDMEAFEREVGKDPDAWLRAAGAEQVIHLPLPGDAQRLETNATLARRSGAQYLRRLGLLADSCHRLELPLVHLSSSRVFDGLKKSPYTEEDPCAPRTRLGQLQWEGEMLLRERHARHLILRSDWIFGRGDLEWFRRVLEEARQGRGKLTAVDRRFSPTPADDLARVLLAIALQIDCHAQAWGTFHYAALQPVTEAQFLETIVREAARYDAKLASCCESLEISLVPPAPPLAANSALNCQKLMETFGIKQRSRAPMITWILEELHGRPHAVEAPVPAPPPEAPEEMHLRERDKRKKGPRKKGPRARKKGAVKEASATDSPPPATAAEEKKP